MTQELRIAIVVASMSSTYLLLLWLSPKYRDDTVKMLRFEKSTFRVAVDNPIETLFFFLSLIIPVLLMDLPV